MIQQVIGAITSAGTGIKLVYVDAIEAESTSAQTSDAIDAPNSTQSGDLQFLFAWQDSFSGDVLTPQSGQGWVEVFTTSSSERPSLGVWYSTTVGTSTTTVSGTMPGGGAGEDWNLARVTFRPSKPISNVYFFGGNSQSSAEGYTQRLPASGTVEGAYNATDELDGIKGGVGFIYGLSGRPVGNDSSPSSINYSVPTGNPNNVTYRFKVGSSARIYEQVWDRVEDTFGACQFNSISDSGRQTSYGTYFMCD